MLSIRQSLPFMAFCAVLASLIFARPAVAADAQSAFIQKLGDTALMSLTEKKVQRVEREKRVRDILRNNFDISTIGKFALGQHWKSATESQRGEYMKLFEDMIVQTYTTRFEEYSGQTLKVGSSKAAGKDYIVSSQVIQKDGPPVNLEWRVRGGRVIDVVVEGVSMSVTQRSDFDSVIQNNGGKIEGLLSSLRDRKAAAAIAKKG